MPARDQDGELAGALERARDGDTSALFEAVEALRPYLRAVAAGVLGGRLGGKVDASDVVQSGLLASVERLAQFRGENPDEWQRWLVAIVRNEARNVLRYWHQEKRLVAAERPVAGSRAQALSAKGPSVRLPASTPTPSLQAARRQEASRLLEVIDRLPPEQREVLRLRHFEGLSHAEIAERTGRSSDAVRQSWARALRGLRERMRA